MRAKGLFTSRGIFEYYLNQAGFELKSPTATKGLNVTAACQKIDAFLQDDRIPDKSLYYTCMVFNLAKNCCPPPFKFTESSLFLTKLYGKLCNSVHGHPWHGPSVLIYSGELDQWDSCILTSMCKEMKLQYGFSNLPPTNRQEVSNTVDQDISVSVNDNL